MKYYITLIGLILLTVLFALIAVVYPWFLVGMVLCIAIIVFMTKSRNDAVSLQTSIPNQNESEPNLEKLEVEDQKAESAPEPMKYEDIPLSQGTKMYSALSKTQAERANSYVVLDVETTGLSADQDRIVEIGILKVVDGQETDKYEEFINIHSKISKRITNLTGITQGQVDSGKEEALVAHEVSLFIQDLPVVAHNAPFDSRFVSAMFSRQQIYQPFKYVNTVPMAKRAFPELPNYKLETLIQKLHLADHEQTHRAMDDVYCTRNLYEKIKASLC
jgi:DNA polymerase III epsilon subunit family exonuclease